MKKVVAKIVLSKEESDMLKAYYIGLYGKEYANLMDMEYANTVSSLKGGSLDLSALQEAMAKGALSANDLQGSFNFSYSVPGYQYPNPKKVKKVKKVKKKRKPKPAPPPPLRHYFPGDGSRWGEL